MAAPEAVLKSIEASQREKGSKLGEWEATAICGNDILSSVLYVGGVVVAAAGWLGPVCLLLVAGILYLYRFVFGEAISALPLNGGSYNVLLNTTSKAMASFAACLGTISYIATGVVSATTAATYLQTLWADVDIVVWTIGLLLFFACLNTLGISESAQVALAVFVVHVATLTVLCAACAVYAWFDASALHENFAKGFPAVEVLGSVRPGTWATALLFGSSSGVLGFSGFESSSQYVEQQAEGVFVKTLRNMQLGVAVFNPVVCLLALCVLRLDEIVESQHALLAVMARRAGQWFGEHLGGRVSWLGDPDSGWDLGEAFMWWVSLDAFLVLCGAVLTAYVGINGLISRMAKDRCLPQVMLQKNAWRGTNHNIIFGYFFISASQVLIFQGDINALSGVYAFAFLGLVVFFSFGTMLLKFKRPGLPREVTVTYTTILVAVSFVLMAYVGNMLAKPQALSYFAMYLLAVGAFVVLVSQRIVLLKLTTRALSSVLPGSRLKQLKEHIAEIQNVPFVFFCKYDDLYVVNKSILYVRENEQTQRLLVVHVSQDPESSLIKNLSKHIEMFDAIYPRIKISLLTVMGTFSPGMIEWLSRELGVEKNKMFITCIDSVFKYKIQDLGGVRVITH